MSSPNLPMVLGEVRLGAGWRMRCQSCGTSIETDPGGTCPECGDRHDVPTLPTRRDRLPDQVRKLAQHLSPLGTWFRRSPWLFLFFWGALLTGSSPFSLSFLGFCGWGFLVDGLFPPSVTDEGPIRVLRTPAKPSDALPAGATPRPKLTAIYRTEITIVRSWWQVNRIRNRRGISVHVELRAKGLQGRALDLRLRFRGPDDRLVKARLPNYRGSRGEALASHRGRPLKLDDSLFSDLWIYVPLRALSLPHGLERFEGVAELDVETRGVLLARHHLPIDLIPMAEDLWAPQVLGDSQAEGLLMEAVHTADQVPCGVCGDLDGRVDHACPMCGALHHIECWDYLDGCSRFGCSESPGRRAS